MAHVGTVKEISGVAQAVGADGVSRVLVLGDPILEGDVITTIGETSSVKLSFDSGRELALSGDEKSLMDESVYAKENFDNADITAEQQALLDGGALPDEATAAGDEGTLTDSGFVEAYVGENSDALGDVSTYNLGTDAGLRANQDFLNPDIINQAPEASDDVGETFEEGKGTGAEYEAAIVATGNVLANDVDDGLGSLDGDLDVAGVSSSNIGGEAVNSSGSFVLSGEFGTLVIDEKSGAYTYTVDETNATVDALNVGDTLEENFTYTVTDGDLTDTASLAITINGTNDAPVAIIDTATTDENVTINIQVLSNDSDVDSDSFDLVSIDTAGLNGVAVIGADGTSVDYNPGDFYDFLAVGEEAIDTFTYTITDNEGENSKSTTQIVEVTLTGTNDQPIVTAAILDPVNEVLDGLNENEFTAQLLVSDVDATDTHNFFVSGAGEDNAPVAAVVTDTSGVALGIEATIEMIDTSAGTFKVVGDFNALAVGESATVTFEYYAVDSARDVDGNAFDGTDERNESSTSEAQTVTVTILGTNDQPVVSAIVVSSVNEVLDGANENTFTAQLVVEDVDATDTQAFFISGANGDNAPVAATVTDTSGVNLGINATVEMIDTDAGTFRVVGDFNALAVGERATVSFQYYAVDDNGLDGSDGINETSTSLPETVTVTILGTNDQPQILDVSVSQAEVIEGLNTFTGSLEETDLDVTDEHTFEMIDGSVVADGFDGEYNNADLSVVVNPNGTYSVTGDFNTLAVDESTTVTFQYRANDQNGFDGTDGVNQNSLSDIKTVTLTITGTNDAPVAHADFAGFGEFSGQTGVDLSQTHTIDATDNTIGYSYFEVLNSGTTVTISTDGPTMDPNMYLIRNDGDITADDIISYNDDGGSPAGSFSNALITATLEPGSYIAVVSDYHLSESELIAGFNNLNDGFGGVLTGDVTLTFNTSSSIILGDTNGDVIYENDTFTLDVLANDTDVDHGATFTLDSLSNQTGNGEFTISGNQLLFTPGTDFDHLAVGDTETISILYTMSDEHDASSSALATLKITGTNDTPSVSEVTVTPVVNEVLDGTNQNEFVGELVASDVDDGDTHDFFVSGANANNDPIAATVTDNSGVVLGINATVEMINTAAGTFKIVGDFNALADGEKATVTFEYYAVDDNNLDGSDGINETSTSLPQTVTVTILGTNDAPIIADVTLDDIPEADTGLNTFAGNLTETDLDVTDTHEFFLVGSPDSSMNEYDPSLSVIVNLDGSYTLSGDFNTLAVGESTIVTFDYKAVDDSGTANDTSTTETVSVTITGTNDGPVAVADGGLSGQLAGNYYGSDAAISGIGDAEAIVAGETPDATFIATRVDYELGSGNLGVGTNLQNFLDHDAGSLNVDPSDNNRQSVLVLDGDLNFAEGDYVFKVHSDDGYQILIDGVVAGEFTGNRAPGTNTNPSIHIDGGEHHVEIIYWDQGGRYVLNVEYSYEGEEFVTLNTNAIYTYENDAITIDVLENDTDIDHNAVFTLDSLDELGVDLADEHASIVNDELVFTPGTDFDYLAVGESTQVVISYTMSDEHGASSSATATLTIIGTNDKPEISDITINHNESFITFVGENAGYSNVLGVYQLDDNEDPINPEFILLNSNNATSGDLLGTFDLASAELHYFVLPNGANSVDGSETLAFDASGQLTVNGNAVAAIYSEDARNAGGTHQMELIDQPDGSIQVLIEDTVVNSDQDFNDLVVNTNDGRIFESHDHEDVPNADDTKADGATAFTGSLVAASGVSDADTSDSHVYKMDGTASVVSTEIDDSLMSVDVTVNTDGTFSLSGDFNALAAGETATVTFDYHVEDNALGGLYDGTDGINESSTSDIKTVTLTISGTNDQPVIENVVVADPIAEVDTGLNEFNGTLHVSDDDVTDAHIFQIDNVQLDGVATAGLVTLTDSSTGAYTMSGDFNYLAVGETATVTFEYRADDLNTFNGTDGINENSLSEPKTVTLTIVGTNDAPEVSDHVEALNVNGEASISLATYDVADIDGGARDIEDDLDAGKVTQIKIETLPEDGTLTVGGVAVSVGDVFAETVSFDYKSDYSDVPILFGTKDDVGNLGQWGIQSNGTLALDLGGITGTISGSDNNGAKGIGYQTGGIETDDGTGIGIVGTNNQDNSQIDFTNGETMSVHFDAPLANAEVGLSSVGGNFVEGTNPDATAVWSATLNGVEVASGAERQVGTDDGNPNTVVLNIDVPFDTIVFTVQSNGNSNYSLQYIEVNPDFNDSFIYSAIDSDGMPSGDTAIVTLTGAATNFSPDASDDSLSTDQNTALDIDPATLLANDIDSNVGDILTITSVTGGANGTAVLNLDGTITFTPTPDYNGPASFTYTVSDGDLSDTATVNIDVINTNEAPTIVVDTGNISNANDVVAEAGLEIIGSDAASDSEFATGTFKVTDPDGLDDIQSVTVGDTTFTIGSGPGEFTDLTAIVNETVNTTDDLGTVKITAYDGNGTFDYSYELNKPTIDVDNQEEQDSFAVKVIDKAGEEDTSTVTLNITDDTPKAYDNAVSLVEGSTTAPKTDVVLILDRSGSLDNDEDEVIAGIKSLFDSGSVNSVFISSFSSTASVENSGNWYTNLDDALTAVNNLYHGRGDGTDYDAALQAVTTNFTAPPAGGDRLISVFMSDGDPTEHNRTYSKGIVESDTDVGGIGEETAWINFLISHGFDDSYAIGVGGANLSNLEPIAWSSGEDANTYTGNTDSNAMLLSNIASFGSALIGVTTTNNTANASVLTDAGVLGQIDISGADGWADPKLTSVEYNGNTYTFTNTDTSFTITTTAGTVTIDNDGSYNYTALADVSNDISDSITYTVADTDGSTASAELHLTTLNDEVPVVTLVNTPVTLDATNDTDIRIPENVNDTWGTTTSELVINESGSIDDLNVELTLTHTWDDDLDIFLVAPDGTRVALSTDNGGSGNNYTNTVFDDEASNSITGSNAPFTGTFRPEGDLSDFDGMDIKGTWTLEIEDDAGRDIGTLDSWSLDFTSHDQGLSFTDTDGGSIDLVSVANLVDGSIEHSVDSISLHGSTELNISIADVIEITDDDNSLVINADGGSDDIVHLDADIAASADQSAALEGFTIYEGGSGTDAIILQIDNDITTVI